MAGDLQQRLESLRSKAQMLTSRYEMLLSDKRDADAKISELNTLVERQKREIGILNQQLENLRVVSTITPSRDDVQQSRAILSQLVRDIDKCISELTD